MNILKKLFRRRGFEVVIDDCRRHPNKVIKLPTKSTKYAAAYDIYSPVDLVIEPGEKKSFYTDVKAYCRKNEAIIINVRSSMGRHPIMLANTQGWIDSDYYGNVVNDGNISINLNNIGSEPFTIKTGERIAQAMFTSYLTADLGNSDIERIGGLGSTGL